METKTQIEQGATEKITKAKQSVVISKKEAKKIISLLKPVINANSALPQMECIKIDIDESGVKFSASDLESILIVEPTLSSYSGEISTLVHGKYLEWFFNKALGEEIIIEFSGTKCTMVSGNFKVDVETEPIDNYPIHPKLEIKRTLPVTKQFSKGISDAIPFLSNDDLRPALTGINLKEYKGNIFIAATDAHRLFFRDTGIPMKDKFDVILSKRVCSIVSNSFKCDYVIEFDPDFIRIKTDTLEFIGRSMDVRFPDWSVVIPQTSCSFNVNRIAFIKYLDIVQHFANMSTKLVKFNIIKNRLFAKGGDDDFGMSSDYEMDISNSNQQDYEVSFNVNFLLIALSVNKYEYVTIKHTGISNKAIIIDDEILVMPLQTNQY